MTHERRGEKHAVPYVPLAAIWVSSASTWSRELPVLTTPSLNLRA